MQLTESIAAPQQNAGNEYLSSREAAAYLHIRHRTLLEWARRGIIPAIPLGCGNQRKTWLFCKTSLDEYLLGMMTSNRARSAQATAYVN